MAAIRKAMEAKRGEDIVGEVARARIADLEQSGQMTLLNQVSGLRPSDAALSGQLVLYRKGFDVPAIVEQLENDEKVFPVVQFQTDGKSKPIEGVLYFVVIGDNVGLIASNVVTGKWLERYLTWLLKDIGDVIEGEDHIELNAQVKIEYEGKSVPAANQISIHPTSNLRETDVGPISRFAEKAKGAGATVLDVLKILGFSDDAVQDLASNVPEGGTLEGDFRVFIKEKGKRVNLSPSTLDHAFRNFEEDRMTLDGRGGKMKNGLLKLSEPVRVNQIESWLDAEDAIVKITETLYAWAAQGRINLIGEDDSDH